MMHLSVNICWFPIATGTLSHVMKFVHFSSSFSKWSKRTSFQREIPPQSGSRGRFPPERNFPALQIWRGTPSREKFLCFVDPEGIPCNEKFPCCVDQEGDSFQREISMLCGSRGGFLSERNSYVVWIRRGIPFREKFLCCVDPEGFPFREKFPRCADTEGDSFQREIPTLCGSGGRFLSERNSHVVWIQKEIPFREKFLSWADPKGVSFQRNSSVVWI